MFGFLASLPSLLGKGIQGIGSGIKAGVGRLGQMGGESGGSGIMPQRKPVPMTPGFNPDAPMPNIGGMWGKAGDRMPEMFHTEEGRWPTQPDRRPGIDDAQLREIPTSRYGGSGQIALMGANPDRQAIMPRATSQPGDYLEPRREDMPIPALPNRGTQPTPYNDYDASRYDYLMKHAKRDEAGNLLDKEHGGGFQRSGKSILQNALLGAARYADTGDWGKMLGGALGGSLGATANPQAGYEQVFDAGPGARMMQDQARRDAEVNRQREQRMGGLKERGMEADIGLKEAQRKKAERVPGNIGEASWGTYDTTTGKPIWERPAGQTSQQSPYASAPGIGLYNRQTGEVKERIAPKEKPMTNDEAEAERIRREGPIAAIAEDSYNGRGGDAYVKQKLPKQYQDALNDPEAADKQVLTAAREEFKRMRAEEKARILDEVKANGIVNRDAIRRGGKSKAAGGAAGGPTAKLSDLKKLLQ